MPQQLQLINFKVATFAGLLGQLQNSTLAKSEVLSAAKYRDMSRQMDASLEGLDLKPLFNSGTAKTDDDIQA